MKKRNSITTIIYMTTFFFTAGVMAADFCATTATEIQAALTTATSNGESDFIKIKKGFYAAPNGGFNYGSGDQDSEFFAVEISGGWFGDNTSPCTHQTLGKPSNTVLNGGGSSRVFRLSPSHLTDITLTDIYLTNGYVGQSAGGGALYINTSSLPVIYTGRILIERNVFSNNYGDYGAVYFDTSSGTVDVRNNLFAFNHTALTSTAAFTYFPTVAGSEGRLYFTNNTVASNTTDSDVTNTSSGVAIIAPSGFVVFLGNNVLWNNEIKDLRILGDGIRAMSHNDVNSQYISLPLDNDLNNISEDPFFNDPLTEDFSLHMYSPVINEGYNSPGSAEWYMGDFDILGRPRVYDDGTIDMGAYEIYPDGIFHDGFE